MSVDRSDHPPVPCWLWRPFACLFGRRPAGRAAGSSETASVRAPAAFPAEAAGDESAAVRRIPAALNRLASRIAGRFLSALRGPRHAAEREAGARLEQADRLLEDVERIAGPSCLLSGHASGSTVDLLIRMGETQHRTARLWVRTEREILGFDLVDGQIARAIAEGVDLEGERLGDILVGMAAVSGEVIDHSLELAGHLELPLGVVLLENRAVSAGDLQEALRQQSMLRLSRALFAEGAAYALAALDPAELNQPSCRQPTIDPRDLVRASSVGCPTLVTRPGRTDRPSR